MFEVQTAIRTAVCLNSFFLVDILSYVVQKKCYFKFIDFLGPNNFRHVMPRGGFTF